MTTRRNPYRAAHIRQPIPDVDPEAEATEERQLQPRGEEAGPLPPSAFVIPGHAGVITADRIAQAQADRIAAALRDLLEEYRQPPLLYAVPLAAAARHPTVTRLAGYALRETAGTPGTPSTESPQSVLADGVATDALGTKLTYTPPAGGSAKVLGVSWFNNTGTPTVQLQLIRAGATHVVRQDTASYTEEVDITLEDGDTLRFEVTVAGAATSTADAALFILEASAPSPAVTVAGVVELRHGSAGGALLWTVVVPAGASRERIFPRPLDAPAGTFAVVSGGTVAGALIAG